MSTGTAIYRLTGAPGPWGEYSAVLFHGIASLYQRGFSGELLLERMGPFIPPVTMPSGVAVIVTDALKQELDASDLTGLSFAPVIKKLIVRSRWHTWDLAAPEPKRYPRGSKPENYILTRPHAADAAEEMGDLWELRPDDDATADVFKRADLPDVFVSDRAKQLFESRAGDWLVFAPA